MILEIKPGGKKTRCVWGYILIGQVEQKNHLVNTKREGQKGERGKTGTEMGEDDRKINKGFSWIGKQKGGLTKHGSITSMIKMRNVGGGPRAWGGISQVDEAPYERNAKVGYFYRKRKSSNG